MNHILCPQKAHKWSSYYSVLSSKANKKSVPQMLDNEQGDMLP